MAKVRPVFQETAFQSTAFQDQAWGLAAFQVDVFQGTNKNQYLFQNNAFQNDIFTDAKYTTPAVFDTLAILIKIINETVQSAEDKTRLKALIKIANESVSVQSFRYNLRQLVVLVAETVQSSDSSNFAKTIFITSTHFASMIFAGRSNCNDKLLSGINAAAGAKIIS